jgi:hypothetical protein
MQVLPEGQKSSSPLQFNTMHILPQSRIPVAKLPLDFLIASRMKYRKKFEKGIKTKGFMGDSH